MKPHDKRNRKAKPSKKPFVLPLADKIKLIGIPVSLFAIVIWAYIWTCKRQQSMAIDKVVKTWQAKYALSDEQTERLKSMELLFHGTGNPFSNLDVPTKQEVTAHHIDMSLVVDAGNRERFLTNLEQAKKHH